MMSVELDKSELQYENLINYRICEELYISFKILKKYNSFGNMCRGFKELIDNNIKLYGELNIIFNKVVGNVSELYNLERWEVINYLYDFFTEEKWKAYQPIVEVLTKVSYLNYPKKK